jgi:2-polyprenyl-3-methyl-5-hydroxy-6-metoxy-1,4-benzoquinol methylase
MSRMDDRDDNQGSGEATAGSEYAERLTRLETARWKQLLDVQRPYRWNLRRLNLGRTLDVGCGIGRNLRNLGPDAVGVDHNAHSIAQCRRQGLTAFTTQEFFEGSQGRPESFDSILCAHLLEHVSQAVADDIVGQYLPYLRPGGQVVFITPQEVGFRSDETHIRWVDRDVAEAHAARHGLSVVRSYSFPFPRPAGKVFTYNEFVTVARKP